MISEITVTVPMPIARMCGVCVAGVYDAMDVNHHIYRGYYFQLHIH